MNKVSTKKQVKLSPTKKLSLHMRYKRIDQQSAPYKLGQVRGPPCFVQQFFENHFINHKFNSDECHALFFNRCRVHYCLFFWQPTRTEPSPAYANIPTRHVFWLRLRSGILPVQEGTTKPAPDSHPSVYHCISCIFRHAGARCLTVFHSIILYHE